MNNKRRLTEKDLAYDSIASEWASFIDDYDTRRRAEVLLFDLLEDKAIGQKVLDAGCGLGYFSSILLQQRPRQLVAIDIAPNLVKSLKARLPELEASIGDLMDLSTGLGNENFDVVFSSEVVEHTPDAAIALRNLCGRVAVGGYLVFSCPNQRWKWLLHLAKFLGIRKKYLGYENWLTARQINTIIKEAGLKPLKLEGIHILPWQILPKSLLRWIDKRIRKWSFGYAINHAVLAMRS